MMRAPRRGRALALGVAVLVAAGTATVPVAAVPYTSPALIRSLGRDTAGVIPNILSQPAVYWGAYASGMAIGRADAPWDMASLTALQRDAKKRLSLLEWGEDWYDCGQTCGLQPFHPSLVQSVRSRGLLPVISWGTYRAAGGSDQPDFRLRTIIDGTYDDYIRSWATAARNYGHPFFLRMDWEMNTHSVPYSEVSNGNQRGEFVAMWRHVHDIFVQVGAKNVTWVWCPNVDRGEPIPLASVYPGDAYVDWVGLDGYNWGTNPNRPGEQWRGFSDVFSSSLGQLARLAPSKPVMIGETASTEFGGSKATWITNAYAAVLKRYPAIRAVVWFNKNADQMDWMIESSTSATNAFARAVADRRFVAGGTFGMDTSPIPPPTISALALLP